MEAVGDASLGSTNASFLQTLDQIIEMEARETEQAQKTAEAVRQAQAAADAAGTRGRFREGSGKVQAAADAAGTPGTRGTKRGLPAAAGARKSSRSDAPDQFLCPILKTRMTDPVVTEDGQTCVEVWSDSLGEVLT
jgi:hypothetical protein